MNPQNEGPKAWDLKAVSGNSCRPLPGLVQIQYFSAKRGTLFEPNTRAFPQRLTVWLLGVIAGLICLTGCASIGPPVPPSLELPKPPADLRAARKGERVTLTWSVPARTTDRQSVRYLGKTLICRAVASALKECGTAVGEVSTPADSAEKSSVQKITSRFTDMLASKAGREDPDGFATYAVEVLNTAGRGAGLSNQVRVPLLPTLPPFSDFAAQTTAQGVMISWKCLPASGPPVRGLRYLFRIYRHPELEAASAKVAEVDVTGCIAGVSQAEKMVSSFLDQSFEWENTFFYRGTVVSVMEPAGRPAVEVEGDDTPEVKVLAHDVFPPAVPSGLQAVFSGSGQQPFIDLIWSPVRDVDLEGYNVYRHEAGHAPEKLNVELVKMPAFRDTQVEAGKNYFYSVSALDQRGNESRRSEETNETVP
jgi:hypothetical protein